MRAVQKCLSRESRRRDLRKIGAKCGVALRELLVVVIVLGVLSAIVVPQFTNAGVATRDEQVKDQLRMARAAVELYRAQHRDAVPDLTTGWKSLMTRTDVEGKAVEAKASGTALVFGPYLPAAPLNPLTGGSRVVIVPEDGADWWWDAANGKINALDANGAPFVEVQ